MKHRMSILREIPQLLPADSSYANVRACVASLIFLLLVISCGPPPQGQYLVPEPAIAAAERHVPARAKRSQEAGLPESAMVRLQEQPYLRNVFKNAFSQPMPTRRTGLDDFYARTQGKAQHIAIISGGSLDVLKAFVAKGWAPIVMVQFQGRTPEILPLSDYNDQTSEVYLQNPTNFAKRRLRYTEFETTWRKNSRNKCVLITPQALNEASVQNVLGKYLPADAFQEISIRSR